MQKIKKLRYLSFALVMPCLLLSYSANSKATEFEIGIIGGVSSARDPDASTNQFPGASVDVRSGNGVFLTASILQSANPDGGLNFYEFLLGSTSHEATIEDGSGEFLIDLDAYHYHIGGTYGFENTNRVYPYFVLTAGLSEYDSSNGSSDSFLSVSLGVGTKIKLTDRFFVRVDARGLATLVEENTAIFCRNSSCGFVVEGNTWWQVNMSAGLVYRF